MDYTLVGLVSLFSLSIIVTVAIGIQAYKENEIYKLRRKNNRKK